MAEAKRTSVVREVVEGEEVVLTLSIPEARALKRVCQRVEGPASGPRQHIDSVENALYRVVGHITDDAIRADGGIRLYYPVGF